MFDVPRLEIEARDDPRVFLAVRFRHETIVSAMGGSATGRLTQLAVIEPYPLELIGAGLDQAIARVVRFVALIRTADVSVSTPEFPAMPDPLPLLKRLGEFVAVIARWATRQAGAVAGMLADLGEAAIELVGKILDLLKDGADKIVSHVAIEVRLDARTYQLRQIWVTPVQGDSASPDGHHSVKALGLHLKIPRAWQPSLVFDNSGGKPLVALVARLEKDDTNDEKDHKKKAILSTDLWYDRLGGATEAVRDTDGVAQKKVDDPFIQIFLSPQRTSWRSPSFVLKTARRSSCAN